VATVLIVGSIIPLALAVPFAWLAESTSLATLCRIRDGESGLAPASLSSRPVERAACEGSDMGTGHRAFDLYRHDCNYPVQVTFIPHPHPEPSMSRLPQHSENHLVDRIGWLRAAVLGANDGIISTASLIVGVAAAAATRNDVLIAGAAGLVAGAMSMAAGEYVSVSSQSDTEQADLARERKELSENPVFELDELADIYVKRGVDPAVARQVAQQLMAKDALTAHARDELGISDITTARPVQAALISAVMFSVGAAMPLLMVVVLPANALVPIVSAASLAFLALLGAIGAKAGGANIWRATIRVTFWGALALAITAGVGKIFGTVL
jgi:VIT1/CCC1 family predicted Fe2+/Mn2+ transporter